MIRGILKILNIRTGRFLSVPIKKISTVNLIIIPTEVRHEKMHNYMAFKDKYSCILDVIILLCNNPVILLIRAPDKRGY